MSTQRYGLLSVKEAAAQINRTAQFVYDETKRKRLPRHKIGGRIFVSQADLDSYVVKSRQPALSERQPKKRKLQEVCK
jgi:excisionase family DNA binding protein